MRGFKGGGFLLDYLAESDLLSAQGIDVGVRGLELASEVADFAFGIFELLYRVVECFLCLFLSQGEVCELEGALLVLLLCLNARCLELLLRGFEGGGSFLDYLAEFAFLTTQVIDVVVCGLEFASKFAGFAFGTLAGRHGLVEGLAHVTVLELESRREFLEHCGILDRFLAGRFCDRCGEIAFFKSDHQRLDDLLGFRQCVVEYVVLATGGGELFAGFSEVFPFSGELELGFLKVLFELGLVGLQLLVLFAECHAFGRGLKFGADFGDVTLKGGKLLESVRHLIAELGEIGVGLLAGGEFCGELL